MWKKFLCRNVVAILPIRFDQLRIASNFSTSATARAATKANTSAANVLNEKIYGQPTASTHPHLINRDELVVGVKLEEFKQRRHRLMVALQKYVAENTRGIDRDKRHHVVIIPSSTKKYMSDKIPYVFRQNSDFYYLCGCLEPDTVLMMSIDDKNNIKSTLFMRPKDKHAELWEGARTGVDLAPEMFGVEESYPVDNFKPILIKLLHQEKPLIWYDSRLSDLPQLNNQIAKVLDTVKCQDQLLSPITLVHGMRLIKSPAEQNLMRRTCQIASEAINDVMSCTKPGQSEHHIFAMVDYQCRLRNASYLAYPPVVASGANATTIHYIENSQLTKSGDLVLMDAGCEYGGYTSDITRTWPVNGEFSEPQKILYDIVLEIQKDLINTMLKEGGRTLDQLFDMMCIKLGKYLQEVGIVSKSIDDVISLGRAGYEFCPHHVSHYLGMDVHDTPQIPRNLNLLPGMVCTVEPGIYIPKDRSDAPKEFRGIGVRVEDDILIISDNKVEILSGACIKERTRLENLHK
uniref:Aminopeptidase P N-terminal domain-containing protein n=1 Tax=Glossina brevipalpis TaxID=37001 RepID=A0A1A9WA68_9MUSC